MDQLSKKLVSLKVGPSRSRKRGKTCRQKRSFLPFVTESQVKFYLVRVEEVSSLPYDEVCPSKSRQMRNRGEDKPGRSLSLTAAHPHGRQKTSRWSENTSRRTGEDITARITDKELISGAPISK